MERHNQGKIDQISNQDPNELDIKFRESLIKEFGNFTLNDLEN